MVIISHGFQTHYIAGFVNGLAQNGISTFLVRSASLDPALLDDRVASVDYGQNLGTESGKVKKLLNFLFYHLKLFWLACSRRKEVFHVIGLLPKPIVSGLLEGAWFRLCCRQYWLTVHNLLPHDQHTRFNFHLYRLIYRLPHRLVVHTEKMKQQLHGEFAVPLDKVTVIEHGLNDAVSPAAMSRMQARQALGLSADEQSLVVLFFGNIHPYKGVDMLLRSWSSMPDRCHVLVAGKTHSPVYRAELEALAQESSAAARVALKLGWIADEDIPRLFAAADLMVMPYRHIDQSGVIFLALRYGIPVLATDVGSISDYIPPEVGRVIPPDDESALIQAISEWSREPPAYSRTAIIDYARRFEWQATLRPLIAELP